ncbi:MAG: hypothetical protein K6E85_17650 [Lachnospiraceae bacterium]|nr:hypothetical protein [Lachnospiraceae bacterium]
MKTGRKTFMIYILLPVFCMLINGCATQNDPYALAVDAYSRGEYSVAEPYFLAAVENGDTRLEVRLGHAYNLLQLGNYSDAVNEFLDLEILLENKDDLIALKKAMLSAYLANKNFAGAARVYDELSRLVYDAGEAEDYTLEACRIRADLYEARQDKENLIEELKKIIEIKKYAGDESIKLYKLRIQDAEPTERLKAVDDYVMYVSGHKIYVEDYIPAITIMFDAADEAGYVEYEHDSEYYFQKAEEFMQLAEERGIAKEELLKFKIVIAERRGKMELAYKLLGVYLNHCPDDQLAVKEKDYLENRIGLTE